MSASSSAMVIKFELDQIIQEDHKNPIYSVKFCDIAPSYFSYFASVGANSASVYRVTEYRAELVQGYLDEDLDEALYACIWCADPEGAPLLMVAGLRGVIKGINVCSLVVDVVLLGHGGAINDLKAHPEDADLLFSASKDESIRLWNIRTCTCVCIFAGDKGHRDEVLALDVHMTGSCFVSVGMDTSIRIWSLKSPELTSAIALSSSSTEASLVVHTEEFPLFVTTNVHSDYVDSVKWLGDLLLTKSTKGKMLLWGPDSARFKGAPLILHEYSSSDDQIWYIRMDVCVPLNLVAVGSKEGRVYVHSLGAGGTSEDAGDLKGKQTKLPTSIPVVLQHPKCVSAVRQVSFSYDARHIVYSCDNGMILLWSIVETKPPPKGRPNNS